MFKVRSSLALIDTSLNLLDELIQILKLTKMKLIAYLFFNGNCQEALQFYKKALDGEITMVSKGSDAPNTAEANKDKIMHARLVVGDMEIYFSDWFASGESRPGTNVQLSLQLDKAEQVDKLCKNLSEGGKIRQAGKADILSAVLSH